MRDHDLNDSNASQRKVRIFVTGATGVVGSRLVPELQESGYEVVAMVRPTSDSTALREFARAHANSVKIVVADLLENPDLAGLMSGCDVVVHTAACVDPHGEAEALYAINVNGTRLVLEAAMQAKLKHFIQISSLSVIMGDKDCYKVTEAEPLRYCREAYANSKIEAEQLVMNSDTLGKINVTALRPGFIYGPNERSWLPKMIYNIRKRTAMLVGNGSKETNLIYTGNLCRAIRLAILNPVAYNQIYNLTDGQLVTKRQLFDVVCKGLGLPKVLISVPMPVARFLVNTSSAIAVCAPARMRSRLALFSRPALRLVGLNQGFDITKAERELGYTDRISFEEGMTRTLMSFRTERATAKVRQIASASR